MKTNDLNELIFRLIKKSFKQGFVDGWNSREHNLDTDHYYNYIKELDMSIHYYDYIKELNISLELLGVKDEN